MTRPPPAPFMELPDGCRKAQGVIPQKPQKRKIWLIQLGIQSFWLYSLKKYVILWRREVSTAMGPKERELVEGLYRQHFKKLFLYADAQLNDPERTRDVVQDTFHEAIRHVDTLSTHENPGGWLMRTLQNKLRESERARRRYLLRFLSLDSDFPDGVFPEGGGLPEEPPDAGPAPPGESALEKIERALSPEEYRLLKRLIFDRASHLQVAREFHITVYASEKRLERIRDKLSAVFPGRRRKKRKKVEKDCQESS